MTRIFPARILLLCISFATAFILLSIPAESFGSCGTIKGWVDTYFDKQNKKQGEALYTVHCRAIMERHYKSTPEEHELLAGMIKNALTSFEYCDRNLAIKNFFMFDQLYWLQGTEVYKGIVADIDQRIKRSSVEIGGALSLYEGQGKKDYCMQVNYEIKGMQWQGKAKCITKYCREIDVSHLMRKEGRLASFTSKAARCFDNPADLASKAEIVEVKSEILNMRRMPAPKGDVITKLVRQDFLIVKDRKRDWLYVIDQNCREGWVAGYLTKNARSR